MIIINNGESCVQISIKIWNVLLNFSFLILTTSATAGSHLELEPLFNDIRDTQLSANGEPLPLGYNDTGVDCPGSNNTTKWPVVMDGLAHPSTTNRCFWSGPTGGNPVSWLVRLNPRMRGHMGWCRYGGYWLWAPRGSDSRVVDSMEFFYGILRGFIGRGGYVCWGFQAGNLNYGNGSFLNFGGKIWAIYWMIMNFTICNGKVGQHLIWRRDRFFDYILQFFFICTYFQSSFIHIIVMT